MSFFFRYSFSTSTPWYIGGGNRCTNCVPGVKEPGQVRFQNRYSDCFEDTNQVRYRGMDEKEIDGLYTISCNEQTPGIGEIFLQFFSYFEYMFVVSRVFWPT